MKKCYLFLIVFLSNSLFSATLQQLLDTHATQKFIPWNAAVCFGDDVSLNNTIYNTSLKFTSIEEYRNYYSNEIYGEAKFNKKSYNGIPCFSYAFNYSKSVGDEILQYFDVDSTDPNNTDGLPYAYIYFIITSIETVTPQCQDTPDNNIFNGLAYQGMATDNSSCQSMYNDNGDGNGFQYVNTDLSGQCAGFCYYNLPDSTNTGSNTDDEDNSNTDNNTDNNNTNNNNGGSTTEDNTDNDNDEETELSDLIPYLDEVEQKNQNIKDSLDTLNTNLNTHFNTINSNNNELNNTMSNLDSTLNDINNSLQNLDTSNNNSSTNNDDYSGVADSLEVDPDISSDLDNFKETIESSLESSFNNYSNVFGFGGYGAAPDPIEFTVLGRTYVLLDPSILNPHVEQIRNIFLVSAYIFGLFLVFRGN